MPNPEKPRHQSGYSAEDLEQVKSACLTVAVTLGAYMDDLCIVGGLVPALLIDAKRPEGSERHPGTNDLDIGLALGLLDNKRYAELSERLRAEGFSPDVNESGNETVQRWRLADLKVTVDFLMAPTSDQREKLGIRNLQSDFGAIITPGLELAFADRELIELEGTTLKGEPARRTIPVCGPAAFVVLKSLAFGDRAEPKDAFDLVYVVRYTPGQGVSIAERLAAQVAHHRDAIEVALADLSLNFGAPDSLGPGRAADFVLVDPAARDGEAADAHGYVDDLLTACRQQGLTIG
jgi:hypothetical protein